jgi:3'-phosphoadenosine 5'-phosphosulfate sulfotransferase (PAPS reductase)/FAD synthetase
VLRKKPSEKKTNHHFQLCYLHRFQSLSSSRHNSPRTRSLHSSESFPSSTVLKQNTTIYRSVGCWTTSSPVEANNAAMHQGSTIAHVFHSREEAELWLDDVEAHKNPKHHHQENAHQSTEEDSSDADSAGSILNEAIYTERRRNETRGGRKGSRRRT